MNLVALVNQGNHFSPVQTGKLPPCRIPVSSHLRAPGPRYLPTPGASTPPHRPSPWGNRRPCAVQGPGSSYSTVSVCLFVFVLFCLVLLLGYPGSQPPAHGRAPKSAPPHARDQVVPVLDVEVLGINSGLQVPPRSFHCTDVR